MLLQLITAIKATAVIKLPYFFSLYQLRIYEINVLGFSGLFSSMRILQDIRYKIIEYALAGLF